MTYKINKTDGNLLTEIPDGEFDTASSSLTLIGRNVTSFGETINENFVKLLENFASPTAPDAPLKGQMWYDTSTGRLNIYNGVDFRTSGGPIVSPSMPSNMVPGDLWINNSTNQMWFYDGTDTVLVGPTYSVQQGKSGFHVDTILDSYERTKVITKLYSNDSLLGIFSNVAFNPLTPIPGFSSGLTQGFTANSLLNLKFDVTATRAESLVTGSGEIKTADNLVYSNEDGTIGGSLTVQSADGVRILGGNPTDAGGAFGDTSLKLEGGNFVIENNESGKAIQIRTKKPTKGSRTAIHVDAETQRIGFFNVAPTATVDITGDLAVSGNLKVTGDLVVSGNAVSIEVTNLQVEDKTIDLNKSPSGASTDTTADGGGLVLLGTTNKTVLYSNSQSAWVSSEHFSIATGKQYQINGTSVLTSTQLGTSVINSSLQTLGKLQLLNIASGINVTANTITAGTNSTTGSKDLILTSTTGNISASGKRIMDVANIDYYTSPSTDAANKKYVDERVLVRPIALTLDLSDYSIASPSSLMTAIENVVLPTLDKVASIYSLTENPDGVSISGTIARVHVYQTVVNLANIVYNPVEDGTADQPGETAAYTKTTVDKNGVLQNTSVVQKIIPNQIIQPPAATVSVVRKNLKFQVQTTAPGVLSWVYIGEIV